MISHTALLRISLNNVSCEFPETILRVGPNSPIGWIRENILQIIPEHSESRKKILLGLNFYGYDFGGASGVQCKL